MSNFDPFLAFVSGWILPQKQAYSLDVASKLTALREPLPVLGQAGNDGRVSMQTLENVNAGGDTQVKEWTLTAPGTADQIGSFKWRRPTALAAGDDVTYTVQAKKATGNTVFQPGQLIASEVPSV